MVRATGDCIRIRTVLKRNTQAMLLAPADRSGLDAKLAAAHGKLEKKFLEGGAVLISIIDILKRLIGSLDALTGALDGQTTTETMAGIRATAIELGGLTGFELSRQERFEQLSASCKMMQENVGDMRETMRYLRTFAITVKITGAGLAEFAGFADEIRERIQSGANEVDKFGVQLTTIRAQLEKARAFSGSISKDYCDIVPKIVRELEHDAGRVAEHHKNLVKTANEVKALARGVQGKIATVLSALQIGDITRQRIEHIRTSFEIFEQFRRSAEAEGLGEETINRIDGAINHLAAAQMDETLTDFQRECRKVMENMARFVDDAQDILALRDTMHRQSDGEGKNFLSGLEANVAAASKLVLNVEGTSNEANEVALSTSRTASSLLAGIEVIRSIKTDIHYMALNSNLRCSKLGDEGRSVNVVSGELRVFAEKLEEPANKVLEQLQAFETTAVTFNNEQGGGQGNISEPLNAALDAIRQVSGRMDESIAEFEREGQEVFSKVSAAIGTLDFENELGDVLQDCLESSWSIADLSTGDISGVAGALGTLSNKIFRTYTMASERDIHRRYFPVDMVVEAAPQAAPADDEELFEDALF
jgi:ABC-type transporter Mla subunit MlaD